MKILLCTNYMPPRPESGGIEFAALELRACWEAAGHEVTWVSSNIPRLKESPQPNSVRVTAGNLLQKLFGIDIPLITPFCIPTVNRLVKEHDVIMTHSLTPGISVVVMALGRRAGKPVVTTQHVPVIDLSSKWMNALQQSILLKTASWAVKKGVQLTFVSDPVRDWFQKEAALPEQSLHMTRVGINNEDCRFVPAEERPGHQARWKLNSDTFNVLFIGRFEDKKGLPLIRDLAIALPDIHFTLRGHGTIDVAGWNLPNVEIVGFVNPEELRSLYAAHDLLILPSFGEGWPAVVPQAMACGLRCMISPEAFSGYNRDSHLFDITLRQPQAWITALQNAADREDPESARKERSNYAHQTWSWSKTAETYLDIAAETASH